LLHPTPALKKQKEKWIVSREYDLFFFIGSTVFSLIFFFVYKIFTENKDPLIAHENEFYLVLMFYTLFDHPHIFQTFSRSHFDHSTKSRRKYFSLAFLFFLALVFFFYKLKLWGYLMNIMSLWGLWHIYKQNYGILAAYHSCSLTPKLLKYFEQKMLGLTYSSVVVYYILLNHFKIRLPQYTEILLLIFLGLIFSCWICKISKQTLKNQIPRILFISSICSFTVWSFLVCTDVSILVHVAIETIYHNIQYQGWVMHYQNQSKSKEYCFLWLLSSMLYGCIYATLVYASINAPIVQTLTKVYLAAVLYHYYIDGQVWKLSSYPEIKKIFCI